MNLGELYIKISVDDSAIDSLKTAFNNAANAAEQAAGRMEEAFSSVSNSANSVGDLSDSLQDAVKHGEILGNVLSEAFNTVIDLAGKAANAVTGFIGDSVNSFSDFEQNYETFQSTFGNSADEFYQWMQDNSSRIGMNLNELMEHANESGIILQRANAERREAEAQGEQLSTDEQKAQIDQRLSDFKAGLAAQETELKNHQSDIYNATKQSYQDEYDALKDSLSQQLDALKQHNDEAYEARSEGLQQQLTELKDELSDEYDALRTALNEQVSLRKQAQAEALSAMQASFDSEYSALKSSLDSQLSSLQRGLSNQVSAMQRANSQALADKQRSVDAAYNAAKNAMDKEVSAYQKATDDRIKQINKEYTERYKLIDEEKYNQLKALQDEIDALDEQDKVAQRAAQARADQEKIADLTYKAANAKFKEDREKAARDLAELELSIQERNNKDMRSDRKDSLRKQMDDVRTYYDNMKSELKEQQSEQVSQYKESRSEELSVLKASNSAKLSEMKAAGKAEVDAMRQSQSDALSALRQSNQDQISAARKANSEKLAELKKQQKAQIEAQKKADAQEIADMQKANSEQLKEKKRSNEEKIREQEKANKDELSELKKAMDAQEKEEARSNKARLDEVKRANNEKLTELKRAQQKELDALKEHNRKLKEEEAAKAKEAKKAVGTSGSAADITEEDRAASMESLKTLLNTAADVGARRNKDASYVMSIFESMNYGRFATFDNLGLGYANKTGIAQMVADMGARLGRDLDPENFNDVAIALEELANKYEMTGAAAKESKTTIAGAMRSAGADWHSFMLALAAPEEYGLNAEDALGRFMDDVEIVIDRAVPIVENVISRVLEIISERGPEIYNRIKETVLNSLSDEWREKLERFAKGIGGIVTAISKIAPYLPDIANLLLGFLELKAGLTVLEGVSKTIEVLTGTKGLGALAGGLGDLATAAKNLGESAAGVAGAEGLGGLVTAVGTSGTTIASVIGTTGAWTLGAAALFGITGYALNASGAVENFKEKVANGEYNVKESFTHISEEAEKTHTKVSEAYNGAAADIDVNTSAAAKSVEDNAAKIKENIDNQNAFWEELGTNVGTVIDNMRSGLTSNLDQMTENVNVNTASMDTGWSTTMSNMKTNTETSVEGVKISTSGMLGDIKLQFTESGTILEESGSNVVTGFKNGIERENERESIGSVLMKWIGNAVDNFKSFLGINSPSTLFMGFGENTVEGYDAGLDAKWPDVEGFFRGIQGNVTGFFSNAGSWLTEKGSSIISGMKGGIDSKWRDVSTFFGGLQNIVGGFFNNAANWLTSAGGNIISGLSGGISGAWHYVTDFIGGISGTFTTYFSNAVNWLVGAGQNILIGFYNGLVDAWNKYVTGFISDIGQWIVDHKGPEEYDRGLLVHNGQVIMEGLKNGLSDGFEKMVKPLVSGMGKDVEDLAETPNIDYSSTFDGVEVSLERIRRDVVSLTRDIEFTLGDSISRVKEYVKQMMDAVGGTFDNSGDMLYNAGISIMNGLQRGLYDRWRDIQQFVLEMASWIQENKGPESYDKKLLIKNGQWIVEGLAKGLEDEFNTSVKPYVISMAEEIQKMLDSIEFDFSHVFDPMKDGFDDVRRYFKVTSQELLFEWKRSTEAMVNVSKDFTQYNNEVLTGTTSQFAQSMVNSTRYNSDRYQTQMAQPSTMTAILELDHVQFGRLVYQLNNEEQQRVGVSLAGGYV